MSIAVSVLTTSRVAHNNGGGVRQGSNPQSATNHSATVSGQFKKTKSNDRR